MNKYNIYDDIAKRTNGDVYVGVVGPVRCGKSTFISSFMNNFVLPNIKDSNILARAKDELPQSGDGKLVMTTQPKFVPNEAVEIKLTDNINFKIRMIDCVGFMVSGALSSDEEGKARMVKTPWSDVEIPFDEASEIGTKKVIQEHSNIGIFLTTDGSFGGIDRKNYEKAEMQTLNELKKSGKPFVVALNAVHPNDQETLKLANHLEEKFQAPVVTLNAQNLTQEKVDELFAKVLSEFKVKSIKVNMPLWLRSLSFEDDLIQEITKEVLDKTDNIFKISELTNNVVMFSENDDFEPLIADSIKLGSGEVEFSVQPKPSLFYKVLSKQCGIEIKNDFELITNLKNLAFAKKEYDKLSDALNDVADEGYGVVPPSLSDIILQEPSVVRQGSKSSVQIKAKAPSLHIIKVDLETEINPMVASNEQSEEMANYLSQEFAENPDKMWQINMFGKTLQELVNEGLNSKIKGVPVDVKKKMKKTLQRVTNEGKGGVICILL